MAENDVLLLQQDAGGKFRERTWQPGQALDTPGPMVQLVSREAANTAARLALTGLTKGQVVHQLDEDRLYTYLGGDPSDAGDWIGGAKPSELLEHQILPQFTSAYYTGGTVLTNYAADASGITSTNLKAVWGGRVATSIGSSAFNYCSSLVSADFPLVTSIGNYAFQNCSSLTSVDFPLVTTIGNSAFYYCILLTDLYLIAPLSGLDANALNLSSVTTIHLRPAPNTPAGWTEGVHNIAGKTGVTVVFDWTTYPNRP